METKIQTLEKMLQEKLEQRLNATGFHKVDKLDEEIENLHRIIEIVKQEQDKMKEVKVRVTKTIQEIHTCPVTDEEYEEINNGSIILEDVLWGCNQENNTVKEVNEDVTWERASELKKEPINWQERLLEVSQYADYINHNNDILVRFVRDYNESMKECGHSLKTLCKRLNGQFEDDRETKVLVYIPRERIN